MASGKPLNDSKGVFPPFHPSQKKPESKKPKAEK